MKKTPIKLWLHNHITKIIDEDDYEYADNVRYARKGDKKQVLIYKQQQEHGCCGFYDGEVKCPIDNQTYLIGFNFGH